MFLSSVTCTPFTCLLTLLPSCPDPVRPCLFGSGGPPEGASQDWSRQRSSVLFKLKKKKQTELLFYLNIYLFLQLRWVLGIACELLVAACGIYFPDQGLNLGSLPWELRVLATAPQRKSPVLFKLLTPRLLKTREVCSMGLKQVSTQLPSPCPTFQPRV